MAIRAGDMVPAAHIEPLHTGQKIPEFFLYRGEGDGERIGILLTQRMEMQAVEQGKQFRVSLPVEHLARSAKAAARCAGIVDGVPILCGAFRVDPQAEAFSGAFGRRSEFPQLAGGVEDDMIGIPEQRGKILVAIRGGEDMHFFSRHFLPSKPRLKEAAGLGSGQKIRKKRVKIIIGKGLLCKEDATSGTFGHPGKTARVAQKRGLIDHIGRGRNL